MFIYISRHPIVLRYKRLHMKKCSLVPWFLQNAEEGKGERNLRVIFGRLSLCFWFIVFIRYLNLGVSRVISYSARQNWKDE